MPVHKFSSIPITVPCMATKFEKKENKHTCFLKNGYTLSAASAAVFPFLVWLRVAEPF